MSSQTAQALPLVLGLVLEEHRARVMEGLVRDVRAHGNGTTAGDVGYGFPSSIGWGKSA
jgi:alpha-L-rhamnosidase